MKIIDPHPHECVPQARIQTSPIKIHSIIQSAKYKINVYKKYTFLKMRNLTKMAAKVNI